MRSFCDIESIAFKRGGKQPEGLSETERTAVSLLRAMLADVETGALEKADATKRKNEIKATYARLVEQAAVYITMADVASSGILAITHGATEAEVARTCLAVQGLTSGTSMEHWQTSIAEAVFELLEITCERRENLH